MQCHTQVGWDCAANSGFISKTKAALVLIEERWIMRENNSLLIYDGNSHRRLGFGRQSPYTSPFIGVCDFGTEIGLCLLLMVQT
jgi:hypothetical protein